MGHYAERSSILSYNLTGTGFQTIVTCHCYEIVLVVHNFDSQDISTSFILSQGRLE
jgi:hypothetical protein